MSIWRWVVVPGLLLAGPAVGRLPSVAALAAASPTPRAWGAVDASALPGPATLEPGRGVSAAAAGRVTSLNWSGNVYRGPLFTGVAGTWTVPAIVPQAGSAADAQWIGIDGVDSSNLIQAGTGALNANGKITYFAWYEILPAPAQPLGVVAPGDHISVAIDRVTAATWSISIRDDTSGAGTSGQVPYTGPGTTAEFVEERPQNGATQTLVPLADYGSVRFADFALTSDQSVTPSETTVDMTDDAGSVVSRPRPYDLSTASEVIDFVGPAPPPPQGYWLLGRDGGVFSFGAAGFHGSTGNLKLNKPIVGIAARPDRGGYWFVASDGGVFSFDAPFFGSAGNLPLTQPVVGMAPDPDGSGYWLVAADGGIFSFGGAKFFGSAGGLKLNQPIVGMAASPTGRGYWFVARDGGVFTFGDAGYFGSGAGRSAAPVVGIAAAADGQGYFLARADGEVDPFGSAAAVQAAPAGSAPAPIVGIALTATGKGYRLATQTGGVGSFGDAEPLGFLIGPVNAPIVGIG